MFPPSGYAPDLGLYVVNSGNTMAHHNLFTLFIEHSAWAAPNNRIQETDMACATSRAASAAVVEPFNPRDVVAAGALYASPAVLDLAPADSIACNSSATAWPTVRYLPPGNLTIGSPGRFSDAVGTLDAPLIYVIVPRSPLLSLNINASKCRQTSSTGAHTW